MAKSTVKSSHPVEPATLRELFELAGQVAKIAPWKTLFDSDIFGIRVERNEPIGWCCVLGNAGQVYAVNFHLGDPGLDALEQMFSLGTLGESASTDPVLLMAIQQYIGVEFVKKSELESWDKAAYRHAGVAIPSARGVLVPRLVSKRIDYMPWRLEQDEAELLVAWLKAALVVFDSRLKDETFIPDADDGQMPVWGRPDDGDGWAWGMYKPGQEQWMIGAGLDPVATEGLARLPERGHWSLGFCAGPGIVAERDERPYMAFTTLLVDENSGMVYNFAIGQSGLRYQQAAEMLCNTIHQLGTRPARLTVTEEDALPLIQDIQRCLNMKVATGHSDLLEDAFASMMEHLG